MKPISGKLKMIEQDVARAYQRGLSLRAVGKLFNVNGRAVWGCLKRLDIPRRLTTGRRVGHCKRGHDLTLFENQYVSPTGHRGCQSCRNLRNQEIDTIEKKKRSNLQRNYGITLEEREDRRVAQNNKCKICDKEFVKTPHVDHDHETKQIRDLLCSRCNLGIGHFLHNPILLDLAAAYLRQWGKG